MSACASGNPPFDRLNLEQRDAVARKAISLVKEHAALGAAFTVDENEFVTKVPAQDQFGGPYEFLVWNCMMAVRRWMDQTGLKGDVEYFFEAGHQHQGRANALMQRIFEVPELRLEYRYAGHKFVEKEKSRPVQAAQGQEARGQRPT
jgi:hypothetical protein